VTTVIPADRPDRDRERIAELIIELNETPETFHPALALAFNYQIAITTGTLNLGELITSRQEIEAAIHQGENSIKSCEGTLRDLHKCTPHPRRDRPPKGF
jgi:hypothetical protein